MMNLETNQIEILSEELEALRDRIVANHIAAQQVASGQTIQSMVIQVDKTGGVLYGRRAFGTLETGRKAGAVPKSFVQIIQQWMNDKGIVATPIPYRRIASDKWTPKYTPEERGQMSLAGAIAHKIQTEGTSLFRSGGRDDIYSNEIPITITSIKNRMAALFELQIDTITLNKKNV